MPIVFRTATSLNGYLADTDDALEWLFAVPGDRPNLDAFMAETTVLVVGSTTYEFVLREVDLIAHPDRWATYFGERPMYVFSSRDLPTPQGADVRVINGSVASHLPAIRATADGGTVWVQGGGDLAGQFLDAGALDAISLTVAPVALAAGAPLLPRTIEWDRLRLERVQQVGEFAVLDYAVTTSA